MLVFVTSYQFIKRKHKRLAGKGQMQREFLLSKGWRLRMKG